MKTSKNSEHCVDCGEITKEGADLCCSCAELLSIVVEESFWDNLEGKMNNTMNTEAYNELR